MIDEDLGESGTDALLAKLKASHASESPSEASRARNLEAFEAEVLGSATLHRDAPAAEHPSALGSGVSFPAVAKAIAISVLAASAGTLAVAFPESATHLIARHGLAPKVYSLSPKQELAAIEAAKPSALFSASRPSNVDPEVRGDRGAAAKRKGLAHPSSRGAFQTVNVSREVQLLSDARAAMGKARFDEAKALLNRYSAEFPKGVMREEADVLSVELLTKQGQPGAAKANANDFAKKHPDSVHNNQMRNVANE